MPEYIKMRPLASGTVIKDIKDVKHPDHHQEVEVSKRDKIHIFGNEGDVQRLTDELKQAIEAGLSKEEHQYLEDNAWPGLEWIFERSHVKEDPRVEAAEALFTQIADMTAGNDLLEPVHSIATEALNIITDVVKAEGYLSRLEG